MLKGTLLSITALAAVLVFGAPAPASAYDETASGKECADCHAVAVIDPDAEGEGRQGPHGGYSASSDKCDACHKVHAAPQGGKKLLPADTVRANCEVCHDGTGGLGVYGVIKARTGLDPASAHRIDAVGVIPGGDGSTGGDRSATFLGDGNLTCTDCHTPHGAGTVEPFRGDRRRTAGAVPDGTGTAGFTSDRLLKRRPTSIDPVAPDVERYGTDWCAACHSGRMDAGTVFNHPVDSAAERPADYFHYDDVQVLTSPGTTASGSLGRSNRGYVMPYPYTAGQGDHKPICQQCHEDARNIGDVTMGGIDPTEEFTLTTIDGSAAGNPTFQTFPHESDTAGMLVERPDDLCMNCHDPSAQLP